MGLEKSTFHAEKPKKTRKLEKEQKRVIRLDVQKIEPKKMQEINTGDHTISREIVAPTIEQKKTLKTRINTAKAKIEVKKDNIKNGVAKVKQSVHTTAQELTSKVDWLVDDIISLIELMNIDPASKDVQQDEINNRVAAIKPLERKGLLKRLLEKRGEKPSGLLAGVIAQLKKVMNNEEDIDYGLSDRPVVKNEEIEEDDGRGPN